MACTYSGDIQQGSPNATCVLIAPHNWVGYEILSDLELENNALGLFRDLFQVRCVSNCHRSYVRFRHGEKAQVWDLKLAVPQSSMASARCSSSVGIQVDNDRNCSLSLTVYTHQFKSTPVRLVKQPSPEACVARLLVGLSGRSFSPRSVSNAVQTCCKLRFTPGTHTPKVAFTLQT